MHHTTRTAATACALLTSTLSAYLQRIAHWARPLCHLEATLAVLLEEEDKEEGEVVAAASGLLGGPTQNYLSRLQLGR